MSDQNENENLNLKGPMIAAAAITIASVATLFFMGRVWWCKVGDVSPWAWDVWSPHNSQHFIDPYSFTHVLHGVLEFWLIGIVFFRVPLVWRFVIAIFIESSWEVLENTNWIIERYREATMSLDYFGDSILNSIADIACCGIGFWIAYKLRFWRSLALFVVTEIVLLFWIRDSLIVNLIMLLWPIDAIKQWQIGAV
jgi:hypothetical protein